MEFLGQFHPQLTHAPIALIIVGAVFELIGRAVDLDWWRKAALALLVFGVLGAGAAVLSGREAGEAAEKQGVPEAAVDAHEEIAQLALWLGLAALLTRAVAGKTGGARRVVSGLSLALYLATAVVVGVAAHRGGKLVFDHGAAVKTIAQPSDRGEHEDHD